MQDTNTTNTVSTTPSALKKEKATSIPSPAIQVRRTVTEATDIKPASRTLMQKLLMVISKIFFRKKSRRLTTIQKTEIIVPPEKKPETVTVDEQMQKIVSAVAAAPTAKTQNIQTQENTLRKIAERQFMTMDVTQATRN